VAASSTPSRNGRSDAVLPQTKGKTLATARVVLESYGWKVRAKGTKNRSIKKPDEKNWQVTKVNSAKKGIVTLTAGKLTVKTVKIGYKTKKVKLPHRPTTYKVVARKGVKGKRKIIFLDGKKIKTAVVKKSVAKIIHVGTRHVYTGRCTIWGSYANRYVQCTGDYSPAAEEAAWELANLCNSTAQPLGECRNVYGSYFW